MWFSFLIGYGITIMLIFMIFGMPDNTWIFGKIIKCEVRYVRLMLYFVCVSLCVGVGKILWGKFVEKTCKIHWWDYARLPMHITLYTSVPTSATFELLITAFMDRFFVKLFVAFRE